MKASKQIVRPISANYILCDFLYHKECPTKALFFKSPAAYLQVRKCLKTDRSLKSGLVRGGHDLSHNWLNRELPCVEVRMPLPIRNYPRSKLMPGLPTAQQFYSAAEAAIILETSVGEIRNWIQDGRLPSVRFGNEPHLLRIRAQDLEQFIDQYLRSGLIKPAGAIKRGGDK